MNTLDKQYQELLQDILDNGIEKGDRTGTGTKSVFGRMIRHKMSEGFPLLTTKKVHWKSVKSELLWFLSGDTNIRTLLNWGNTIWVGDAYKNYLKGGDIKWLKQRVMETPAGKMNIPIPYTRKEFIEKIKTDDEFAKKWGDLGPIYGKQWRAWGSSYSDWEKHSGGPVEEGYELRAFVHTGLMKRKPIKGVDQIAEILNTLRTNPDSRRMIVSAWNVDDIDKMTLPPCHDSFQFYTRKLTFHERCLLAIKKGWRQEYYIDDYEHEDFDKLGIPTRAISLMWRQRSVDTFLGLPFNIASYGLLLMMVADEVGMVPDELVGVLGDTHLYLNHIEQAKEQITREPRKLPTVHVRDGIHCSYSENENGDIILMNYNSHPPIKAPLSN